MGELLVLLVIVGLINACYFKLRRIARALERLGL